MSRSVVLLLAVPALLAGCAHQIVITPDVSQLTVKEITPIDRNVGYYIPPELRDGLVETPGGGGDKVSYRPYAELEPALFKVLSNVFRRAYPVAPTDAEALAAKDISWVFMPTVVTDSSSDSVLTWPPTKFKVDLTCRAVGRDGKTVWQKRVVGEGEAKYEEFIKDMPLAARRASLKAMIELQKELAAAAELRADSPPVPRT